MKIKSITPTRIDLAGGTLDIFPINVFEDGGITINAAISLYSEVNINKRKDSKIIIKSKDLDIKEEYKNLDVIKCNSPLDLICRIIKFYKPPTGIEVETHNTVPKGSGLGASSSLLIALTFALIKLKGEKLSNKEIIDCGANIEAQSIRVPTGKQDYYAAVYGGINALWFDTDNNVRVEKLIKDENIIKELEDRLILSFTGQSRFSAISNWRMMRRYIDGEKDCVEKFRKIKEISLKMRECLLKGNLDKFPIILGEEWNLRKGLAKGVSNIKIETIMGAALKEGALASKICGAGGGGCLITFTKEKKKQNVIKAIEGAGGKVLPFKISKKGIWCQKII